MASSSSTHAVDVDVDVDVSIWRAVAGPAVTVPPVNSYVYYFPQVHLEQWSPSAAFPNLNFNLTPPSIPCQVISVRHLTDRTSDQVMARIHLQPVHQFDPPPSRDGNGDEQENDDGDIVSYVKVLTPSDANNGGGFTVPRVCADMIFPQLNFEADPPVQTLVLKDTRGQSWEFRHIYRGRPLRHLLTTGWTKFVDAKRLVAGDSVVFMKKKSTNELFVGIRPADKIIGDGSEAVAAWESAAKGMPFEVEYYPKVDIPDFVVMAEKVNKAIQMRWGEGMRVRMAVERGETCRMTWIKGVITAISEPEGGLWSGSHWRNLQVSWDSPEVEAKHNIKKVNPWQVEYESLLPLMDPDLPSAKRFKLLEDSEQILPLFPAIPEFTSDGIRGARHASNPTTTNSSHRLHLQLQPQHGAPDPELSITPVSTELNTGSSYSDIVSPVSQRTVGAPDPEVSNTPVSTLLSIGSLYSDIVSPVSQRTAHLESDGGGTALSFRLFGKTIVAARYGGGKGGDDGGGADRCEGNI